MSCGMMVLAGSLLGLFWNSVKGNKTIGLSLTNIDSTLSIHNYASKAFCLLYDVLCLFFSVFRNPPPVKAATHPFFTVIRTHIVDTHTQGDQIVKLRCYPHTVLQDVQFAALKEKGYFLEILMILSLKNHHFGAFY